MLRTIFFYPLVFISMIIPCLRLIKVKSLERKGKLEERQLLIHKITHSWSKLVVKLSGSKLNITGTNNIPKDEAVLFVANHQSNFDIPVIMAAIDVPKGFIAKKELEKVPLVSFWMKYIRCIFMDRSNLRKSAEAIVEGINILKSGYSMVIFPEGTRSKGGPANEFKAGSFKLAIKSKVKIIPVTIDGSYKILEANNNKIKASNVNLIIHEPIDVNTLSKEELANLHEHVQDVILSPLKDKEA